MLTVEEYQISCLITNCYINIIYKDHYLYKIQLSLESSECLPTELIAGIL